MPPPAKRPRSARTRSQSAAAEQQKLATALDQLAKHYDALEQGKPEETRLALREAEKALGLKPNLDRQFAQSEQLAKAAEGSPEEMLKQLEKALPQNPVMRQELSGVAKNALQNASEKLAMASARGAEDREERLRSRRRAGEADSAGRRSAEARGKHPGRHRREPAEQSRAAEYRGESARADAPGREAPKNTPPADANAAKPDGAPASARAAAPPPVAACSRRPRRSSPRSRKTRSRPARRSSARAGTRSA